MRYFKDKEGYQFNLHTPSDIVRSSCWSVDRLMFLPGRGEAAEDERQDGLVPVDLAGGVVDVTETGLHHGDQQPQQDQPENPPLYPTACSVRTQR